MDFSAMLTIATFIAGVIWAIDAFCFKKKRLQKNNEAQDTHEPKLVEYARSFFPILLIVLILRSFIVEPFRIPSGSMKPTLLEGDFILVNKFCYGLRLPITGTKFVKMGEPKRGDILVFRYPKDTSIDFIKRVVGVPGDKIAYKDKTLYLNGEPVAQDFKGKVVDIDVHGYTREVKHFNEKLPNKPHDIYVMPGDGKVLEEVTVPEGKYFVMGDNRDNSEDSRVWGFVPEDLILGKAFFLWLSWDSNAKDIRWSRMGHEVR
ncbi:signal peptidase I [Candidatus Berkiella aquae]|nr:signal peptidase I [Candidatus Berkiella aquae]